MTLSNQDLRTAALQYDSFHVTGSFDAFSEILRQVNPKMSLRSLSKQRMRERLKVGITTRFSPEMKNNIQKSQVIYAYPFSLIFFLCETDISGRELLDALGAIYRLYPQRLAGNLALIRSYVRGEGCDIVSDDDPHKAKKPGILFPDKDGTAKARVAQFNITAPLLHDLWAFVIELGRIHGVPIVGMRGSDQSENCELHGPRCFCRYASSPYGLDYTITSAQGYTSSYDPHQDIHNRFQGRKIGQEYSSACAASIHRQNLLGKHGTLILRFVRFMCSVEPPSDESLASVEELKRLFPDVVANSHTMKGNHCAVRFRTHLACSRIK